MAPLSFDGSGWLAAGGRSARSPHCDARPDGTTIDLVVIHNISLPAGSFEGPAVEDLFLGRLDCSQHPSFADLVGLKVSSHFFIRRDGEVIQFVGLHERAWHAGVSCFQDRARCNDFSVGIELEGTDHQPYGPGQMLRLTELLVALTNRLPDLRWIVGHSDIAPGRKTDPGPAFSWQALLGSLATRGCLLTRPAT